jgi:hypothetical protein
LAVEGSMVTPSWFTPPQLARGAACALLMSTAALSFFILENCLGSACPARQLQDGPPLALVPSPLWHPGARQAAMTSLAHYVSQGSTGSVLACVLRAEVPAVALVLVAWSSATLLLLALLATFAPRPRQAELDAFRRGASLFAFGSVFSIAYVLAVSSRGYADVACIVAFWAFKHASHQLRVVLPLRSEALRRAARVRLAPLAALCGAHACVALTCAALTRALALAFRAPAPHPALSRIVVFELSSLAMHAVHHAFLAANEALHVADEVSARRAAAADAKFSLAAALEGAQTVPSFTAERRADARDALRFVYQVVEGAWLLAHHAALFATFGFRCRVGDCVLLYDVRHFGARLLGAVRGRLARSLALSHVRDAFPTASAGALPRLQHCTSPFV